MAIDREVQEYQEKYGHISKDYMTRLNQLINSLKTKRHKELVIPMISRALKVDLDEINILIYLTPKPAPRPRHNSKSNIFYVKGAAINKNRFNKFLDKTPIPRITTAVIFNYDAYLPFPSDMNKVEKILAEMGLIRPIFNPDFDNLVKPYTDMVQNRLIFNDSYVIESLIRKFYSAKPRVEMEIKFYKSHDSAYNELATNIRLRKEAENVLHNQQ